MPYEKTETQLDSLIAEALQDTEISDGITSAGLDSVEVTAEVKKESAQIWEAATSEFDTLERQEADLTSIQEKVELEAGPAPRLTDVTILETALRRITTFSAVVFVLLSVGVVYIGLRYGWRTVPLFFAEYKIWFFLILTSWLTVSASYVLFTRRQENKAYDRWRRLRAERDKVKAALEKSVAIETLRAQIGSLKANIDKALLEKRIKPKFREIINRQLNPSFDTRLNIAEAKGLSEVFDPKSAIDTTARNSLRFMLENMPGGSIGIAGSRGAGKTTLLRLFCGPKRILTELKGKPVLAVLVSAPVAYQARDFILYLFSAVCQAVLSAEGEKYTRPPLAQAKEIANPGDTAFFQLLKPLPRALVYVGTFLSLASCALTIVLLAAPPPPKSEKQEGQATSSSAPPGQAAASAPAAIPPIATAQSSPISAATPSPDAKQTAQQSSRWARVLETTASFLRVMEFKPGETLLWGALLVGLGLTIGAVFNQKPIVLLTTSWLRMIGVVPGIGQFAHILAVRISTREHQRQALIKAQQDPLSSTDAGTPESTILKAQASDWLKRIKFQQSYTSGWSGSLKLPVGLEGGVNNAVTLAENQLSLPEIVSFFTSFLEVASQKYQVIIGIDELDKLESDEKAQRFLNDIKSVFGLERCFYLISVSENAMSNFERRGLPFRDVFDSSFDSIIYVDYLNFESARTLLQKKVVGKPIPFLALSYCLSGGLARDLIRNFRAVMEIRQSMPTKNDMESICSAVVAADLKAKIRATAISAKKIVVPAAGQFLENLYKMESVSENPSMLMKAASRLRSAEIIREAPDPDKQDERGHERLRDLAEELATYMYYASTILEYFDNKLTEQKLMNPQAGGKLDDLARARQLIAVNPKITRSLLDQFRKAHDLSRVVWRTPPVSVHRNNSPARNGQKRKSKKAQSARMAPLDALSAG